MKTKKPFFLMLLAAVVPGTNVTVSYADPPTNNLVLWLRADAGVAVSAGASNVTTWTDQAPGALHSTTNVIGTPQLTNIAFPNGNHPVISFDGASGFSLNNPGDFDLMGLSIYVVGDVNNQIASQEFIAHWAGFGLGISDATAGRIKWVTYNGTVDSMEPTGASLSNDVPYLVTATYFQANGENEKSLYVDGFQVGFETNNTAGIYYGPGESVNVGMLFDSGAQFLTGHIAEILVYSSVSKDQQSAVEAYLNSKYFLQSGGAGIITQPQSQQVAEFSPVTFTVVADGTPPFTYQWQKDNTAISGATNNFYTIPSVLTNDAGNYSVTVGNSVSATNSDRAVLTVIADTNPPTISSALLNYGSESNVTVAFSELVDPATATNIANYSINNSVSIIGATAVPQTTNTYWSNYISSVVLTTTPITSQSILTVKGVQDRAGNAMPNTQAVILVPGSVTTPPSTNLLCWLEADKDVLADNKGVYEWDDQSGTANDHNAVYASGNVQVGQAAFPNAFHPVLYFDGTSDLAVDNTADFAVTNLAIYVVAAVDNTKASRIFLGNYPGWALGISDGQPGVIKWYTYDGTAAQSMEPPASHLGNWVPAVIRATYAYPGVKTLAINTMQLDLVTNTASIDYTSSAGVTVGALFNWTTQNLIGDIAEILVYTNVSPDQDAAVESYLAGKYFTRRQRCRPWFPPRSTRRTMAA